MRSKDKTFIELAKMVVHSKQMVSQVDIKKINELPGHMLYIYTDTVLLKPSFQIIEQELIRLADNLGIQIAVQAPRCVGNISIKKLSPLKRFLLIAIYDGASENPCCNVAIN